MFHVKQIFSLILIFLSWQGYSQHMLMFKDAEINKPKTINLKVKEWNETQPSFKYLSTKEKEFYYWVNYSRINPATFFDSVVTPIVKTYPQLKGNNLKTL